MATAAPCRLSGQASRILRNGHAISHTHTSYRPTCRAALSTSSRTGAVVSSAFASRPTNGSTAQSPQPATDLLEHVALPENFQTELKDEMWAPRKPLTPPLATVDTPEHDPELDLRYPRNVQALFLKPLRRTEKYGVPTCDLQLRSYSVRNLEFFADFAMRAAYYLNLAAYGPVPLPRITERWTVIKASFIFKKAQENFERRTLRRLIQIKDGHPEAVGLWLAFLQKHAYHGVGMKANVWDYSELGVGKNMDTRLQNREPMKQPQWAHFGSKKNFKTAEKVLEVLGRDEMKVTRAEQRRVGEEARTRSAGVPVAPSSVESPSPVGMKQEATK